jgi:hypothetical protein
MSVKNQRLKIRPSKRTAELANVESLEQEMEGIDNSSVITP